MATKSHSFKVIIAPFNGDPDILEFFIEQVKFKLKNNNWDDSHALAFVKSKLTDAALKFYISSPLCKNAKNVDELFSILRKFFRTESDTAISQQFAEIKFETNESIYFFANRLENIVRKRFPQMKEDSIQQVLTAKFTDLIPTKFKLHLLTQKTSSFSEMVDALEKFQEIAGLTNEPSAPSTSYATLNQISHDNNSNKQGNDVNSESNETSNQVGNNSRHSKFLKRNRPGSNGVSCQWCYRSGHTADKCFALKRSQNQGNFRPSKINSFQTRRNRPQRAGSHKNWKTRFSHQSQYNNNSQT